MGFSRDLFGKKRKGSSQSAAGEDGRVIVSKPSNGSSPARSPDPTTLSLPTAIANTQFESVMDRPFASWNDIENVIARFVPKWTHRQRGCIILHLIRFLELKVVMDEYVGSHLLAPSCLVETAWQALVLETLLYKRVTCYIQDFHGRTRRMIHHSLVSLNESADATKGRFQRAQSLFQCCYGEKMPVNLDDIDSSDSSSIGEASALTDTVSGFHFTDACTSMSGTNIEGGNGCVMVNHISPPSRHDSNDSISRSPDIIFKENCHHHLEGAFSCFSMIQHTVFGEPDTHMTDHVSMITPETEPEGVEVIDIPNEVF